MNEWAKSEVEQFAECLRDPPKTGDKRGEGLLVLAEQGKPLYHACMPVYSYIRENMCVSAGNADSPGTIENRYLGILVCVY
jgi:hypothetical protein